VIGFAREIDCAAIGCWLLGGYLFGIGLYDGRAGARAGSGAGIAANRHADPAANRRIDAGA
jgi:hypothetical protein